MNNSGKKINVLVVDDSTLMRRVIMDILNSHPDINVVGYAINGKMALEQLEKLKPDVITLDVEMPYMNGLETLKEIRKIRPTPTIMLSSLTKAGVEVTMQALEYGAIDFIAKPDNKNYDLKSIQEELINKILAAAEAFPVKLIPKPTIHTFKTIPKASKVKTVVIGSSTGGPQALKEVVPYLPKDIPAQFIIVQHMPPKFTDLLAQRLNNMSLISVSEAKDGDILKTGHAFVAPGGYHLCIEEYNKIKLTEDPPLWGVRPAIDITVTSAAKAFRKDLICVILTGMGHDGTRGVEYAQKCN